jgi:hypothetical protein
MILEIELEEIEIRGRRYFLVPVQWAEVLAAGAIRPAAAPIAANVNPRWPDNPETAAALVDLARAAGETIEAEPETIPPDPETAEAEPLAAAAVAGSAEVLVARRDRRPAPQTKAKNRNRPSQPGPEADQVPTETGKPEPPAPAEPAMAIDGTARAHCLAFLRKRPYSSGELIEKKPAAVSAGAIYVALNALRTAGVIYTDFVEGEKKNILKEPQK